MSEEFTTIGPKPLERSVTPGPACIVWMDSGAWLAWWENYHDRLAPQERRQIRQGDYRALQRPIRPKEIGKGQWLKVARNLEVRVVTVELRRGTWRIIIDKVQDFRAPHSESVRGRKTYEQLEDATTLAGADGRMGEPEPMETEVLERYAERARQSRRQLIRDLVERR